MYVQTFTKGLVASHLGLAENRTGIAVVGVCREESRNGPSGSCTRVGSSRIEAAPPARENAAADETDGNGDPMVMAVEVLTGVMGGAGSLSDCGPSGLWL